MSWPLLAVVVDTEEEFEWGKPFDRSRRSVGSIAAQLRAHEIYDRMGVSPTYVIAHPVAADPAAAAVMRGLHESGRAEIGAHLHPWVTPPHIEEVNPFNSYHGNLPRELEREKIINLTSTITDAIGVRPKIFKAGRYGFGPNTAQLLIEAGYEIDCSYVPHTDFSKDGGPNYVGTPEHPFWLDADQRLLEVPLTKGYIGSVSRFGRALHPFIDSEAARRARLPGLLSRARILARSRLSPEGVPMAEQKRLIVTMARRGVQIFTLSYHSPSLEPGNTPYVRDKADLRRFLSDLEELLRFFRDEMGGGFTSLSKIRQAAAARAIFCDTR